MSSWNYRVIKHSNRLVIHEAYYQNLTLVSCSKLPYVPIGEDLDELIYTLGLMLEAAQKAKADPDLILNIEEFTRDT